MEFKGNVFWSLGGWAKAPSGVTSVTGSGKKSTERRDLKPFTRLKATFAGDVDVVLGHEFSVAIEADDNILPLITTEISGETLSISANGSFSTRGPIRVAVTVARGLVSADLSGSGDLSVSAISSDEFTLNLKGSGDVSLEGTVDKLEIALKGSGDVEAGKLVSRDLTVDLAGSGDVRAHATEKVSVNLRGSGDVVVTGSPRDMRSSVRGSGDLTIR